MEKVFLVIGMLLLIVAIVAAGMYGWHGNWGAVILVLGAAFLGKFSLGFVELLLTPFSLPAIHFAKRGRTFLSLFFMTLFALTTRMAYAAYCAVILLYLVRTSGPPTWMAIALAILVAGAPFQWAAQRATEESAANVDLVASALGVLISGALLAFEFRPLMAVAPIVVLFIISAIIVIAWWGSTGISKIRIEALFEIAKEWAG